MQHLNKACSIKETFLWIGLGLGIGTWKLKLVAAAFSNLGGVLAIVRRPALETTAKTLLESGTIHPRLQSQTLDKYRIGSY